MKIAWNAVSIDDSRLLVNINNNKSSQLITNKVACSLIWMPLMVIDIHHIRSISISWIHWISQLPPEYLVEANLTSTNWCNMWKSFPSLTWRNTWNFNVDVKRRWVVRRSKKKASNKCLLFLSWLKRDWNYSSFRFFHFEKLLALFIHCHCWASRRTLYRRRVDREKREKEKRWKHEN